MLLTVLKGLCPRLHILYTKHHSTNAHIHTHTHTYISQDGGGLCVPRYFVVTQTCVDSYPLATGLHSTHFRWEEQRMALVMTSTQAAATCVRYSLHGLSPHHPSTLYTPPHTILTHNNTHNTHPQQHTHTHTHTHL